MSHTYTLNTRVFSRTTDRQQPPSNIGYRRQQNARSHNTWQRRNSSYDRPSRRPHRARQPAPARPRQFAIPPEYFALTKEHFTVIKTTHHLNVLRKGLPPSLKRRAQLLSESVRPAFHNDYFGAQIEEATNKWGMEVLKVLKEHYKSTLIGSS